MYDYAYYKDMYNSFIYYIAIKYYVIFLSGTATYIVFARPLSYIRGKGMVTIECAFRIVLVLNEPI